MFSGQGDRAVATTNSPGCWPSIGSPGASPTAAGRPDGRSPRRYTSIDIGLLAELDRLHGTLSGPATRKLCARAYHRFGDRRFERLAGISNGHLYNLRHSTTYQRRRGTTSTRTGPVQVAIGERRRPTPVGRPGYVRVDSVHQADLDDLKGLYHVNLVDEVTQFQFIGSVDHLHAACLAPVLSALLRAFPFTLHGFHSDNGSEYVNRTVAALLEALHIDEFTKSRARHTNDNALVESKNGSVVRKHLGYGHIHSRHAQRVNDFTQNVLSPYLNFHRPCFFPSETVDAKGRRRKRYRDADIMTPYEKLKSLPEAAVYLTPGTTFQQLDAVAFALSDNDAVRAPCTRHAHGYSGLLTRLPDMSGSSIRFRLISGLERTVGPLLPADYLANPSDDLLVMDVTALMDLRKRVREALETLAAKRLPVLLNEEVARVYGDSGLLWSELSEHLPGTPIKSIKAPL